MLENKKMKKMFEKLIAGGLSDAEYQELKDLTIDFPEYQDILETHHILEKVASPFEEPIPAQLTEMRQSVMRSVRNMEMNTREDWMGNFGKWIRSFVARPEMAVAAITLLLGFFLGRIAPVDQKSISSGLMQQVSLLAKENTNFSDSKNTPYNYSNIEFKEINGGEVALSFDVSTHLEMVRKKDDPLVREVIAQSLLNPTNLGSELKTISFTKNMFDSKIKDALIFSMHNAPIQAVRQSAMDNLTKYQNDENIKNAFLTVLADEKSVKMRLTALDYLDESNINPEKLRDLVESEEIKKSPAVWIKAKKVIENN